LAISSYFSRNFDASSAIFPAKQIFSRIPHDDGIKKIVVYRGDECGVRITPIALTALTEVQARKCEKSSPAKFFSF
jgi:hypothetical protein